MTLDEYFGRIDMLEALIQARLADYEKLFATATKMTAGMDGMPHGTEVTDKVGGIGAKLADYSRQIDMLIDQKAETVKIMEKLKPNEYSVLHRLYVLGMTWEEAAEDLHIGTTTVDRYRKSGLENLKSVVSGLEWE